MIADYLVLGVVGLGGLYNRSSHRHRVGIGIPLFVVCVNLSVNAALSP